MIVRASAAEAWGDSDFDHAIDPFGKTVAIFRMEFSLTSANRLPIGH